MRRTIWTDEVGVQVGPITNSNTMIGDLAGNTGLVNKLLHTPATHSDEMIGKQVW